MCCLYKCDESMVINCIYDTSTEGFSKLALYTMPYNKQVLVKENKKNIY